MSQGKPIGTKSGLPEAPLEQLKAVWKRLPEDAQDYWRAKFESSQSQAATRAEILAKFKIKLSGDGKLTTFRKWLADQDERDAQAERMRENENRMRTEHPDWDLDQVRSEVLKQSYFETLARGDFKLGLATVVQDLNVKRTDLESRRIALLEKKAAAYDRAQAALAEAKNSKGGITPETLSKIESELKLL